jgi:hypothetical protein
MSKLVKLSCSTVSECEKGTVTVCMGGVDMVAPGFPSIRSLRCACIRADAAACFLGFLFVLYRNKGKPPMSDTFHFDASTKSSMPHADVFFRVSVRACGVVQRDWERYSVYHDVLAWFACIIVAYHG